MKQYDCTNHDDYDEIIELDDDEDLEMLTNADEEDDDEIENQVAEIIEAEDSGQLVEEAIFIFDSHQQPVFCCEISPDDKMAVTGGQDDRAFVWDIKPFKIRFQTTDHKESVTFAKFNKSSTLVATADLNGLIQVWNIDGQKVFDFESGDFNWVLWHPIAENILLAGYKEGVFMWQLSLLNSSETKCKVFSVGLPESVVAKLFDDGKRIAVGYKDGSVRIWDLKDTFQLIEGKIITINSIKLYFKLFIYLPLFKLFAVKSKADEFEVICIDINEEQSLVAVGFLNGSLRVINVGNGKIVLEHNLDSNSLKKTIVDSVESVVFGNRNTLIAGTLEGLIQIWHLPSQTQQNEIRLPGGISKLMIDRKNPNRFFASCLDNIFRVIDLRDCSILLEKMGHSEDILDFDLTSDFKYALTCSDDKTCRMFEIDH